MFEQKDLKLKLESERLKSQISELEHEIAYIRKQLGFLKPPGVIFHPEDDAVYQLIDNALATAARTWLHQGNTEASFFLQDLKIHGFLVYDK